MTVGIEGIGVEGAGLTCRGIWLTVCQERTNMSHLQNMQVNSCPSDSIHGFVWIVARTTSSDILIERDIVIFYCGIVPDLGLCPCASIGNMNKIGPASSPVRRHTSVLMISEHPQITLRTSLIGGIRSWTSIGRIYG